MGICWCKCLCVKSGTLFKLYLGAVQHLWFTEGAAFSHGLVELFLSTLAHWKVSCSFPAQAFGPVFIFLNYYFILVVEERLCSSVEQGKKTCWKYAYLHFTERKKSHFTLKFPGFELRTFHLKIDVAMMSRRCFLLSLWTCRGLWLNYTPLQNQICTCLLRAWQNYSSKILFVSKLREGALPVISALLLQVDQKPFKHKGEGRERTWAVRS